MSTPDIDCSRRRPPQALIHTPHSPSLQRGEEREGSRLAASPSVARIFRFRIQTCARWRTCSGPPGVARGGMQVAWRGPSHLEPPAQEPGGARAPALQAGVARGGRWLGGGRSHLAPPERSHGHRRRLESTPGAFCTVLPMSTGGVSHLLQVLFALFCSWSKWLKPPAFCAKGSKMAEIPGGARGDCHVCLG